MADSGIYDRWHKSRPGDEEPRCAEHGLVATAAHLSGDRWQARWRDDAGAQRKANFARKADASRHTATAVADTAHGTYVDPRTGKITPAGVRGGLVRGNGFHALRHHFASVLPPMAWTSGHWQIASATMTLGSRCACTRT